MGKENKVTNNNSHLSSKIYSTAYWHAADINNAIMCNNKEYYSHQIWELFYIWMRPTLKTLLFNNSLRLRIFCIHFIVPIQEEQSVFQF